jgi:DNA-binding protein WhiA
MSFTSTIKQELTRVPMKSCCQRAELSALVRMNGTIQLSQKRPIVEITTENPSTARHIFTLIKNLYAEHPEVLVRKKVRLKKNNVYILRITMQTKRILADLRITKKQGFEPIAGISPQLFVDKDCRRAYLRGAFLASGSVNNPGSASYHLEIVSTYNDHAEALSQLMNQYHLHAKTITRKKGYVIYLKEGDKIGEFLNIIGAHPSLLHFENVRIMKDMRNSVNRLVNCETANLNRTIRAAVRQIEHIKQIDQTIGLDTLAPALREVAETRLQYPELNLTELGQQVPSGPISKSAVNHRLRKIEKIAQQLPLNAKD